ncbi:universal stress protein [Streptomyces marokkonensis]|uniref:Universal stress protein n=1 Tax=Streptomyces marokkonensis TaxID=324855 RepID=A0ABW6QHZ3_9ACTN
MNDLVTNRSIVVGVDGSEASAAALRWAAEQAAALRAEVVAVHAWEATAPHIAPYAPVSVRPTPAQERDAAARLLTETLRRAFGPRTDGSVRAELVEGQAVRVLLNRARGALMLAVGRTVHGQGDVPDVGPVGRECLRHASVPVVAVPAPDPEAVLPRVPERPASAGGAEGPSDGVRAARGVPLRPGAR